MKKTKSSTFNTPNSTAGKRARHRLTGLRGEADTSTAVVISILSAENRSGDRRSVRIPRPEWHRRSPRPEWQLLDTHTQRQMDTLLSNTRGTRTRHDAPPVCSRSRCMCNSWNHMKHSPTRTARNQKLITERYLETKRIIWKLSNTLLSNP